MPLSQECPIHVPLYEQVEPRRLRSLNPFGSLRGSRVRLGDQVLTDFSSNDYLGLSGHPEIIEAVNAALSSWGTGSRASRLMSGDLALHHEAEAAVARLKGTEASLLFGSGYLANLGVVSALCGPADALFLDRLDHASLVDGALLSRARIHRFSHNDLDHLENLLRAKRHRYRRALIAIESLYSMDGDAAPLRALLEIKERYGATLLVDEAHALGVFGRHGEGLVPRSLAPRVDIFVGTFGKALGGYGAFVAGTSELRIHLLNRARSFIFSTAPPPGVVAGNLEAVRLLAREPQRRHSVLRLASRFRRGLRDRLGQVSQSRSQIIPLVIGGNQAAMAVSERLQHEGFYARAVRPPTVPDGTARIRFSLTAHHTEEDVDRLIEVLAHAL